MGIVFNCPENMGVTMPGDIYICLSDPYQFALVLAFVLGFICVILYLSLSGVLGMGERVEKEQREGDLESLEFQDALILISQIPGIEITGPGIHIKGPELKKEEKK